MVFLGGFFVFFLIKNQKKPTPKKNRFLMVFFCFLLFISILIDMKSFKHLISLNIVLFHVNNGMYISYLHI